MGMPLKILIVGAGIGGLTTAIALAQIGAEVDVIEISPDHTAPGVGFGLRVNGLRVAKEIGLYDRCAEIGTDSAGLTYHGPDGQHLVDLSYGPGDDGGPGVIVMPRLG